MRNFYWRKAGCAHGDCVPGGGMELIEQCLTQNQDEQLEEVLLPCAKTYTSSASSALGPVALQDVAAKKDLARLPERLAEREGGGRFEKMAEEVYLAMTVTEEEWERMRWGGEMIPTEGSSTSNFWASLQTFCFGSCLCRDSDAQGKAEDEETQFRTVVGGPESRGLSAFQSVGGGSTVTD
uniref:Uncharacterized protein n=1 Tax=Chromera velia CCMP2878 TaxID=1169474 RepID=A0A0G4F2U3_9ALVE|eukprot:Cvel_14781.t1-p1 / transcript=Cvel_14781.t1 / gene=Cvel_14781 / organism=Chromera_velia_CCMP2878 / gene_product=hypothetical protein / transcript_product=hypothetical protein / location=Cvel_scaffold1064:48212-50808(-) / protein_length=180 / sequence_SO=supercontig / SO=protein_coding / is_pseudo=false